MARHGVAETLTGGVVLLIAGGFLAYAVAHSGRATGEGIEAARAVSPCAKPDRAGPVHVGRVDVRVPHALRDAVSREQRRPDAMQPIGVGAEPEAAFAVEQGGSDEATLRERKDSSSSAHHFLPIDAPNRARVCP